MKLVDLGESSLIVGANQIPPFACYLPDTYTRNGQARLLEVNLIQETVNLTVNMTCDINHLYWALNLIEKAMFHGTFRTPGRVRSTGGRDGIAFIVPDKLEPQELTANMAHVIKREIFQCFTRYWVIVPARFSPIQVSTDIAMEPPAPIATYTGFSPGGRQHGRFRVVAIGNKLCPH